MKIPGWTQRSGTVQIDIVPEPAFGRRRLRIGNFEGSARITFAPDDIRDYDISGKTTRNGSEVKISLSLQSARKIGVKQVQIYELTGQWQGTELHLRGTGGLVLFDGTGTITTSSDPDYPVEMTLRK
jgi:hypothetical protein